MNYKEVNFKVLIPINHNDNNIWNMEKYEPRELSENGEKLVILMPKENDKETTDEKDIRNGL